MRALCLYQSSSLVTVEVGDICPTALSGLSAYQFLALLHLYILTVGLVVNR